jgi:hypothetical protein
LSQELGVRGVVQLTGGFDYGVLKEANYKGTMDL